MDIRRANKLDMSFIRGSVGMGGFYSLGPFVYQSAFRGTY